MPDGKKIQDEAVSPNVVVASNQDLADASDDATDDQAPAIEGKPKAVPGPANPTPAPAKSPEDDQLNKALEILKAKNV
jgi:hypothetical protein